MCKVTPLQDIAGPKTKPSELDGANKDPQYCLMSVGSIAWGWDWGRFLFPMHMDPCHSPPYCRHRPWWFGAQGTQSYEVSNTLQAEDQSFRSVQKTLQRVLPRSQPKVA